jgi:hypothetical protein
MSSAFGRSKRNEGTPIPPGALPGEAANEPVPDNVIEHWFERKPNFRPDVFPNRPPANDVPDAPVSRAFPEQFIGEPDEPRGGVPDYIAPAEPVMKRGTIGDWNRPLPGNDPIAIEPEELSPSVILPWVVDPGGFGSPGVRDPIAESIDQSVSDVFDTVSDWAGGGEGEFSNPGGEYFPGPESQGDAGGGYVADYSDSGSGGAFSGSTVDSGGGGWFEPAVTDWSDYFGGGTGYGGGLGGGGTGIEALFEQN